MKRLSVLLFLCAACPKPNATPDAGARGGVVPADLRDVERAGEGLVDGPLGHSGHRASRVQAGAVDSWVTEQLL